MNWVAYIITLSFWFSVFSMLKIIMVDFPVWMPLIFLFGSGGMYWLVAKLMEDYR